MRLRTEPVPILKSRSCHAEFRLPSIKRILTQKTQVEDYLFARKKCPVDPRIAQRLLFSNKKDGPVDSEQPRDVYAWLNTFDQHLKFQPATKASDYSAVTYKQSIDLRDIHGYRQSRLIKSFKPKQVKHNLKANLKRLPDAG